MTLKNKNYFALGLILTATTGMTLCPPRSEEGMNAFRKSLEKKRAARKNKSGIVSCTFCEWSPLMRIAQCSKDLVVSLQAAKTVGFLKFSEDPKSKELESRIEKSLGAMYKFLIQVEEVPLQELRGEIKPYSAEEIAQLQTHVMREMQPTKGLAEEIWCPKDEEALSGKKALGVECSADEDGNIVLTHTYPE